MAISLQPSCLPSPKGINLGSNVQLCVPLTFFNDNDYSLRTSFHKKMFKRGQSDLSKWFRSKERVCLPLEHHTLYLPLAVTHTHIHTHMLPPSWHSLLVSHFCLCVCVYARTCVCDWFTSYEVVNGQRQRPFCSVSCEFSATVTCLTGTLLSSDDWLPVNNSHINNQQRAELHLQHALQFPF